MKKISRIILTVFSIAAILSTCVSCGSDDSVRRIKQNKSLKVGYISCDPSFDAPFVIEGNKGITAESAVKSANSIGVEAEFIRLNSDEAYGKLIDGTVDCLWNVTFPSKQYIDSVKTIDTGIYYRQVIMTNAGSNITRLADVSGKTMAVVSGSDAQAAMKEASVMESSLKKIKICSNMSELLEALESNSVDCAAIGEPQAMYMTLNSPDKFVCIDTPISENSLVIALRSDDFELREKIAESYVKLAQYEQIKSLCKTYTGSIKLTSSIQNPSDQV